MNSLHHLQSWWKTPELSNPGCYAIYSEKGELLYIGVATAAVGSRLASHFPNPLPTWDVWHRLFSAAYIQIINVQRFFQAPSLEVYLIDRFKPPGNKTGVRR